MNQNKTLDYFGEYTTILQENETHYLIQFSDGVKIATEKTRFTEYKIKII
jgi:hypothetical protein